MAARPERVERAYRANRRRHSPRTSTLGAPGYTAVILQGAALRTQVRQLAGKYEDVVIDVGSQDTGSLRAALTVADTLLIPVQPRTFDDGRSSRWPN